MPSMRCQPSRPGTLTLISYPTGADISGTRSTGGAKGTGVLDIRNLNMPANGEVLIQFDIKLAGMLTNGTIASDQAALLLSRWHSLRFERRPRMLMARPIPRSRATKIRHA